MPADTSTGVIPANSHVARGAILGLDLAENAVDKEVHDDALAMLAWCQMDTQAWNDAKNTWRSLIRRFPDSKFTAEAKLQLAQLNLTH